jgi:hypothetical protein
MNDRCGREALAGRSSERQRADRRWGPGAQPPSKHGERLLGLPQER